MDAKFRKRIESFCKRNGYPFYWQQMEFDFERAVLTFTDSKVYTQAQSRTQRNITEAHIEFRSHSYGAFDAAIYIMPKEDFETLHTKTIAKLKLSDDWWHRYRNADEETRKLMACGKIP